MGFFAKLFRSKKIKYIVEVNRNMVIIETVRVPNSTIVISGYKGTDGSFIKIHKL